MAEEPSSDVSSTLVGAAIAGGVSVATLVALSALGVQSSVVQVVVAITLGVLVAQAYERL